MRGASELHGYQSRRLGQDCTVDVGCFEPDGAASTSSSSSHSVTRPPTIKRQRWDKDTSGENTTKQVVEKERLYVSKENVQEEKIPKEQINIASNNTSLI